MKDDLIYKERVFSLRTESLFLMLAILFLYLFYSRVNAFGLDALASVFLFLFVLFIFYSVNFIFLIIQINTESLKLKFGLCRWTIPLDNIDNAQPDQVPLIMKMGGAGMHFMFVRSRYRVSFNFLEYPRVVVALKKRAGPVRDVSFTTRQPEVVVKILQQITPE